VLISGKTTCFFKFGNAAFAGCASTKAKPVKRIKTLNLIPPSGIALGVAVETASLLSLLDIAVLDIAVLDIAFTPRD